MIVKAKERIERGSPVFIDSDGLAVNFDKEKHSCIYGIAKSDSKKKGKKWLVEIIQNMFDLLHRPKQQWESKVLFEYNNGVFKRK